MTASTLFASAFSTIGYLLAGMAVLAAVETLVPLHARGRWNRAHLGPNLALTFDHVRDQSALERRRSWRCVIWLEANDFGLLRWLSVPPLPAAFLAVAAFDLAFYAAHLSWHKFPSLWRFHAVHHSDPALDVTTTIRQHPVEGVLRYAALAAMAIAIGPSLGRIRDLPRRFGAERAARALQLPRAALARPGALARDDLAATCTRSITPGSPSRPTRNYGNLFSFWDRLFGTFTPSDQGRNIRYGLDGYDRPELQTTAALLALPFRATQRPEQAPLLDAARRGATQS